MISTEATRYYQALVDIGRYAYLPLLFGYFDGEVPTRAFNLTLTLSLAMAYAFQYPTCPLQALGPCRQYTKTALLYRSTMPSIQLGQKRRFHPL